MNNTRRPWLIAGALVTVVAIGVAAVVLWQWLGRPPSQRETAQRTYAAPGDSVVVDASDGEGDLVVLPGGTGQVVVDEWIEWDFAKPSVTQTWTDGTLRIAVQCPADRLFRNVECRVGHTIRVPAAANVRIASSVGDVTVKNIDGDVRVQSSTGNVEVDAATGALAINSGTGDVRLSGLRVSDAEVSVDTGDIRGTFVAAPGNLTVLSQTGDVDLDVPDTESYRIQTKAGAGQETIDLPRQAGAPRTITATVNTGDLRLR